MTRSLYLVPAFAALLAFALPAQAQMTTTDYFGGGFISQTCGPGLYYAQFEVTTERFLDTALLEIPSTLPPTTQLAVYSAAAATGPYVLESSAPPSPGGTNNAFPDIDVNIPVGWMLVAWTVDTTWDCLYGDGTAATITELNLSFGTMLNGGSEAFPVGGFPATLTPSGLAGEYYRGVLVTSAPEYPPTAVLAGSFPLTLTEDPSGSSRAVTIDSSGSTDADGTIVSRVVNCNSTLLPNNCSQAVCTCNYPNDDGSYTGTLTVYDDDNLSDSLSFDVEVVNVPPVASGVCDNGTCVGDEGDTLSFTCDGTDDGWNDVPTLDWDFDGTVVMGPRLGGPQDIGDGNPFTATNTYPDDGTYSAICLVADNDGGSDSETLSVTINNVAPSISAMTGPGTANEGSPLSYSVTASDPGVNDTLVYAWDWADGTLGLGTVASHTFGDEGTFVVEVLVSDDDGGIATQTLTTVVANVAPTLTGACPSAGTEGSPAGFNVTAADPGTSDVLSWTLAGTATGVSIAPSSGAPATVSWTPSYTDAQAGTVTLDVTVDDGDGGTDALTCSIPVAYLDADSDGMPDTWEGQNGLDPSTDDSAGDPDADGISNIDEWLAGSDPQAFGGPSAPVPSAPLNGAEVTSLTPTLEWTNATDPNGDPLTYTFEIYSDSGLANFVGGLAGIPENASGTTTGAPGSPLSENTPYWWRVLANDGTTDSSWSVAEELFVNVANEVPATPVAASPVGGAIVTTLEAALQWSEVIDPDGDVVEYEVEVYSDAALSALEWSDAGVPGTGSGQVEALTAVLVENGSYWWRARGVDEHGLAGDWSVTESFLVSTVDDAPDAPVFVDPTDGGQVGVLSPVVQVEGGLDPEGADVTVEIELSLDASFASAWPSGALPDSGSGVSWDASEEGALLVEDAAAFARARTLDAGGLASGWTSITFTPNSENGAPSVPTLIEPGDGATPLDLMALDFRWANSTDTDGTTRTYDIEVRDGATVMWSMEDIAEADTETGATMDANELAPGSYLWTVRAADELGLESEWADPWEFTYTEGGDDDDATSDDDDATADDDDSVGDDDDSAGEGGSCDCESSVAGGGGGAGMALWLLVGLTRRRRRR